MKEFVYQDKKYKIEKIDSYIPVVIHIREEGELKFIEAQINYMTSDLVTKTDDPSWTDKLKENVFAFIQQRDSVDPDAYAEENTTQNMKEVVTQATQRNHYV